MLIRAALVIAVMACSDALELFSGFVTEEMEKVVMSKFSQLLARINEIPHLKEGDFQDQDVEVAVSKVKASVTTTFIHARSYVAKCSELAVYICDEEEYTIKAVEEGNADEFKDYLEEVLYKSKCCQKDIRTLIDFIEFNDKQLISTQEDVVKEKSSQASTNAMYAAGGAALSSGIGAAGIGMVVLAAALPTAVGLGVAILGLHGALKGCDAYIHHQQIVHCCTKALDTIHELKESLEAIEERLERVNTSLKAAIDENIEDIDGRKLDKLSEGSQSVKHSLIQKVKVMAKGTRNLVEYCRPLKDAETLEDFMQRLSLELYQV